VTIFVWNILLALVWAIALGPPTPLNLFIGFVVGYLTLGLAWRLGLNYTDEPQKRTNYFGRMFQMIGFVLFFARELIVANLRMAYYTVAPLSRMHPGIVSVDIAGMSNLEITVLANLITLTPGTLSLDISEDRSLLIVHCMDVSDPEQVKLEIRDGFQRRVLELMR
jgi:multicomponent Na+:H+ antiporter subunit E